MGNTVLHTIIDVVVDLPAQRIPELCRAFPEEEFYLSEQAVREAVRHHGQFNIIHPTSGLKVDVIIPEPDAYNRGRSARAIRIPTGEGFEAMFASPEDVIIKKMQYYREGGSEKHLRDVTGVLTISGEQIDRDYIMDWAEQLDLTAAWEAAISRLRG